jgi:hypothetical protein
VTNPVIQKAVEKATEVAVRETLALVLTSLAQSQAEGLFLPEATRRLRAEIRGRYGLEEAYLQGLVEGPNGPDQAREGGRDVRHYRI